MLDVREDREMSLTKQRAEYISCITRTHADFKGKAWCGRAIDAFSFVGIDHAAENGRQEGRLVACHECVTAIETALSNGHAAEKRHATTNRKMLREINRLANRCTTTTEVAYDEALIALLKKVGEIPEHLARLAAEPTVTRVCPDSEDGNHVLKQDGPFSVVYCDACGMNKGFRSDG